ncbi:MAG: hypothetical protein JST46_05015 [Bacteroidetes bacterium]|nr:hypothetical protein [Bacteroidota bacterium]
MMKRLGLFLLILVSSAFSAEDGTPVLRHRFIVLPDSRLMIDGKTNINAFQCAISRYCGTDTLVLQEGGVNARPVFVKGFVRLEASGFDCGMAAMTHDFNKTIKAKEHPVISIDFKAFEKVPSLNCGEERFKSTLAIGMAGRSNTFDVECTVEARENGVIHLKGGRAFQFSDFGLETPKHAMGLIKVKDDLDVQFHLVLKIDASRW